MRSHFHFKPHRFWSTLRHEIIVWPANFIFWPNENISKFNYSKAPSTIMCQMIKNLYGSVSIGGQIQYDLLCFTYSLIVCDLYILKSALTLLFNNCEICLHQIIHWPIKSQQFNDSETFQQIKRLKIASAGKLNKI